MDYSNKKLMFITGALSGGGAERVMAILASGCADLGADVSLVVVREGKQTYPVSEKVHFFQIQEDHAKFRVLSRIRCLHKVIKESSAEALIPFLPIISVYTMLANIGVGKKMIMSERADPGRSIFAPNVKMKDRIGNLLMRKIGLFRLADWMVFQTPDAQSWYPKSIQKKSCIIPNPLDTSHLPSRFAGERDKRIVAAGRMSEEKNFPMLIRGFAEFRKSFPEYKLVIYGEGKQRADLERLCVDLHIEDAVSMPGFVSNLSEEIVDAAMYISTSNHEGISNSMLEALGMGIPTIVTDCPVGGARMFVRTDENGILIPMEDHAALVNAMTKIASDPAYAEKISANAEKIREELAAERICTQWLALV